MLAKKVKEVLLEFQSHGLLEHVVLIGSWCGIFYIQYFGEKNFSPSIQTLDVDFLIPKPEWVRGKQVAIPEVLKALDFEMEISGSGWARFVHPELRVEFLVPRLGPKSDDPKKISALEINAMPLRHTSMLTEHLISLNAAGLRVRLPHPGAFALHKLFISERRKEAGKRSRDLEMAIRILEAIQATGREKELEPIWNSFTKKEKKAVMDVIKIIGRPDLISLERTA